MTIITLDATTNPPTVLPPGSARHIGDAGMDDQVIQYWYRCAHCRSHLEVAIGEVKHHQCSMEDDSVSEGEAREPVLSAASEQR